MPGELLDGKSLLSTISDKTSLALVPYSWTVAISLSTLGTTESPADPGDCSRQAGGGQRVGGGGDCQGRSRGGSWSGQVFLGLKFSSPGETCC